MDKNTTVLIFATLMVLLATASMYGMHKKVSGAGWGLFVALFAIVSLMHF